MRLFLNGRQIVMRSPGDPAGGEVPPSTEGEIRADEREEVLEEVASERREEAQWDRINTLEASLTRIEQRLDQLTSSPAADLATADKVEEVATAEPVNVVEAAQEEAGPAPKTRRKFRIL